MSAEGPQGGAAQVRLRYAGPRFDPTRVDVLHYDSASHLLLVVRRAGVLVYDTAKPDQAPQVGCLSASPACINMRERGACKAHSTVCWPASHPM